MSETVSNTLNCQSVPQPCPSCGHCPTCGRGGYYGAPYPYWRSVPYPTWPNPYITYGTGGVFQDPNITYTSY